MDCDNLKNMSQSSITIHKLTTTVIIFSNIFINNKLFFKEAYCQYTSYINTDKTINHKIRIKTQIILFTTLSVEDFYIKLKI